MKGPAMQTPTKRLRRLPLAAALMLAATCSTALAGGLFDEQYHADSFGNLVVYSPAGYKRIVVGQGHVLAAYRAQSGEAHDDGYVEEPAYSRHCRYVPGMFKGRSYMYGLPDHVVPTPARLVCD